MSIDDTFAEAHGSLAVIDLLEGKADSGRQGMAVALRLDRESPTAALAAVLFASSEGDHHRAQGILKEALERPVLPDGRTLLAAMTGLAR